MSENSNVSHEVLFANLKKNTLIKRCREKDYEGEKQIERQRQRDREREREREREIQ